MPLNLKSENGSSILLVLGLASVVAALSFVLINFIKTYNKDLKNERSQSGYKLLVETVRSRISSPIYCSNAFKGKTLNTIGTTELLPFSFDFGKGVETVSSGYKFDNGVVIDKILLTRESIIRSNMKRDLTGAPLLISQEISISIYIKGDMPNLRLSKNADLIIKSMIYYNQLGAAVIDSCFSRTSDAAICTISERTYNTGAAIGTRSRCEPDLSCIVSKVGIVSSSGLCSAPYESRSVGAGLFRCEWCNKN